MQLHGTHAHAHKRCILVEDKLPVATKNTGGTSTHEPTQVDSRFYSKEYV